MRAQRVLRWASGCNGRCFGQQGAMGVAMGIRVQRVLLWASGCNGCCFGHQGATGCNGCCFGHQGATGVALGSRAQGALLWAAGCNGRCFGHQGATGAALGSRVQGHDALTSVPACAQCACCATRWMQSLAGGFLPLRTHLNTGKDVYVTKSPSRWLLTRRDDVAASVTDGLRVSTSLRYVTTGAPCPGGAGTSLLGGAELLPAPPASVVLVVLLVPLAAPSLLAPALTLPPPASPLPPPAGLGVLSIATGTSTAMVISNWSDGGPSWYPCIRAPCDCSGQGPPAQTCVTGDDLGRVAPWEAAP
eukprot:361545-Chlamydomonas_euryale.AAC.8